MFEKSVHFYVWLNELFILMYTLSYSKSVKQLKKHVHKEKLHAG